MVYIYTSGWINCIITKGGIQMNIQKKAEEFLKKVPAGVELVLAAKMKTPLEVMEAVKGGVKIIGENYVQQAEEKFNVIGRKVRWHMIGHLQRNKVKKALEIFDMVETLDSYKLAGEINKEAGKKGIQYPVLIEINSGKEQQKSGIEPEKLEGLLEQIKNFENIKVEGIMTVGPFLENAEEIRPYFRKTALLFNQYKNYNAGNIEMKYLSMGMSISWKAAIEEGANLIRIGTSILGPRKESK
jgi:PLP dependent protein